jgi:hypothetical protein
MLCTSCLIVRMAVSLAESVETGGFVSPAFTGSLQIITSKSTNAGTSRAAELRQLWGFIGFEEWIGTV